VWKRGFDKLTGAGVPPELAHRVTSMPWAFPALDIVEVAQATERGVEAVAAVYFHLGARLQLNWLRDRIAELPRANRWHALARSALRDDLYSLHRALTQDVLRAAPADADADAAITGWAQANVSAVTRTRAMLLDIKGTRVFDLTTLPVALREVRNLLQDAGTIEPGEGGSEQ
jgi:glutamate dehydrogenase